MDMKERIKAIRISTGLSQTDFGKALNVSRSAVINWQFQKNEPSSAMLKLISQKFGINPLYLSGESDLMRIPPDEDEELIDRALENADPMMKALLLGIVKKPDGWRMLAESILTAADTLRDAGFDADEKKPAD